MLPVFEHKNVLKSQDGQRRDLSYFDFVAKHFVYEMNLQRNNNTVA